MTLSFQSEVGVLRKVVMKHPQDAFQSDARIDSEWRRLNYLDRPDGPETEREFVQLTRLLQKFEVEVLDYYEGQRSNPCGDCTVF